VRRQFGHDVIAHVPAVSHFADYALYKFDGIGGQILQGRADAAGSGATDRSTVSYELNECTNDNSGERQTYEKYAIRLTQRSILEDCSERQADDCPKYNCR